MSSLSNDDRRHLWAYHPPAPPLSLRAERPSYNVTICRSQSNTLACNNLRALRTTCVAAFSGHTSTLHVIATGGLHPPYLVFGLDGALNSAQAGQDGERRCFLGSEGEVCCSTRRAVTRLTLTTQRHVATGLSSVTMADGSSTGSLQEVLFGPDVTMCVLMGLDAKGNRTPDQVCL